MNKATIDAAVMAYCKRAGIGLGCKHNCATGCLRASDHDTPALVAAFEVVEERTRRAAGHGAWNRNLSEAQRSLDDFKRDVTALIVDLQKIEEAEDGTSS